MIFCRTPDSALRAVERCSSVLEQGQAHEHIHSAFDCSRALVGSIGKRYGGGRVREMLC